MHVFGTVAMIVVAAVAGVGLGRLNADDQRMPVARLTSRAAADHSAAASDVPADLSTAMFARPASLAELVGRSHVIVVARVSRVASTSNIAPYDAEAGYAGRLWPVTDYELLPERFLLDDGREFARPILLRVFGHPRTNDDHLLLPMPKIGDRDLFFLSINPDDSTYGFYYGPFSRVRIDRSVATFSDGDRSPIYFADGQSPSQFIETIERAVGQLTR